jgi:hypothetical protein
MYGFIMGHHSSSLKPGWFPNSLEINAAESLRLSSQQRPICAHISWIMVGVAIKRPFFVTPLSRQIALPQTV